MPRPKTFKSFARLPSELRLTVWEMALHEESSNRIVFYEYSAAGNSEAVCPTKSLVSPFLAVNQESRECAIKQYPTKLEVIHCKYPCRNNRDYDVTNGTISAGAIYLCPGDHRFAYLDDPKTVRVPLDNAAMWNACWDYHAYLDQDAIGQIRRIVWSAYGIFARLRLHNLAPRYSNFSSLQEVEAFHNPCLRRLGHRGRMQWFKEAIAARTQVKKPKTTHVIARLGGDDVWHVYGPVGASMELAARIFTLMSKHNKSPLKLPLTANQEIL